MYKKEGSADWDLAEIAEVIELAELWELLADCELEDPCDISAEWVSLDVESFAEIVIKFVWFTIFTSYLDPYLIKTL